MARGQGAALDRKKLMADPIMVTTIVVLITFLTLFILYPLAILLVDSFVGDGSFGFSIFKRIFAMPSFTRAITNTLKVGFLVGILSSLIGLLFAYVEVYVRMNKVVGGLFKVVSMLPVVSPPFVLSLSMIMLFGKAGIITRFLLGIYDNNVYGFWGIVIVQTLTFFPVCYMMLKGLLKNIDPSLEEAARDMGAGRWKVFADVTLPLMLPGLGNAFLVTFIESIADFANPMLIGGSYDTLATTIYLQITGAYDKAGAAAMAVVLLCITLAMFAVQKYYLEAKTAATLTGKASRARMLIEDRSVKIPLTIFCALSAAFVILMYICVPIGALFPTWGYKFFPLTGKWFKQVFVRYHGLKAFKDSFVLSFISAPITALLSMIISYLVVKRKFKAKGFIEAVSMLAMAVPGTVLGVGYIRGFSQGVFHTGFLQGIYGTGLILIIVFVVRSLPTGTRSGISALRQMKRHLRPAADRQEHRGIGLRHGRGQLQGLHDRDAAAHQGLLPLRPRDRLCPQHHRHLRDHPARHAELPAHHRADQRVCGKGLLQPGLRVCHHPDRHHLQRGAADEPVHQAFRHQQNHEGGLKPWRK